MFMIKLQFGGLPIVKNPRWRLLSIYTWYFTTANLKITFSTDCPWQILIDILPKSLFDSIDVLSYICAWLLGGVKPCWGEKYKMVANCHVVVLKQ